MKQSIRLEDLVEINPKVNLNKGKEYPYVEMGVVDPGNRYVHEGEYRKYKGGGSKFQAGDTLFARITPCLENGKIVQYDASPKTVGFGSTEFFVFRAKDGVSDPAYVHYLAKTDIVRKPAEKSMSGASGRQRADLNVVKDILVPSRPLEEQRKIAAVLSTYDDLIENNTRRIAILEEMAQRLYREWFVHFRFPQQQVPGTSEVPGTFDAENGRLPEGWELKTLGDLAYEVRRSVQPD